MGSSSLALLFATLAVAVVHADVHPPIMEDELTSLVVKIKGDDNRLFRWDATEHTAEQQKSGACDQLPNALEMIKSNDASATVKRMAAEYATFCITDNPDKRKELSNHDGIHKAIVDLVASGGSASRYEDEEEEETHDPETEAALAAASAVSTMAAHLMYISTFANEKNHQTFYELGAIPALTSVIKGKHSTAVQIMWAAAAMQNLAASYCDTDDDGRCYWDWVDEQEHVVILEEDKESMISDGAKAREAILEDKELIETLKMLSCWGPVQGGYEDEEEDVVYIGDNAITGRDENNPVIIPWAAMGVIKNLALEPKAKPLIEPIMHCICYMSGSPDWLEENKGGAALYHLRRSDPCWFVEDGFDEDEEVDEDGNVIDDSEDEEAFDEDGPEEEGEDGDEEYDDEEEDEDEDFDEIADSASLILVCVDHNFYDAEGYHCDAYQDATDKECSENTDVFTHVPASTACCECGGGDVQRSYYEEDEEEDAE